MAPKVKVSREDIINATVDIVRKCGANAINARTIASILNCSTQPIFSNFSSMEKLRYVVVERANVLCDSYIQNEINSGEFPEYKATGMAYIRFAKEEPELFKLLYMRDRVNENENESDEFAENIKSIVQKNTGLKNDSMKLFHLEMWTYVHGIASMIATGFIDLDWDLISRMLTDAYLGLRKQYGLE